jgi:glycosyltransferase involved in cell wall biosynthesis
MNIENDTSAPIVASPKAWQKDSHAHTSLAVLILTYNERRHVARALNSVSSFANDVVIVDSFSTDTTVEIALAQGARVLQNPFHNHATQFQWGLDNMGTNCDWILRLDADEVIEPDLAVRIRDELPKLDRDVVGVTLDRKHIFMGRWIRHGGRYPLTLTRIFRRGKGRIEQRWMDEHIIVEGGRTVHFSGGFADHNLNDLTFFTEKHNGYATRESIDVLIRKYHLFPVDKISAKSTSVQAMTKRLIKEHVYNLLPFWIGPAGYFLYRYFIQGGVLDGREGLIYHFLQGFWYRFLVGAKLVELESALGACRSNEERIVALEQLTGYRLRPSPAVGPARRST